jgi:hypothetical protein
MPEEARPSVGNPCLQYFQSPVPKMTRARERFRHIHCRTFGPRPTPNASSPAPIRDACSIERLAALVPPRRFNLTRYSGVLAPAATFRPLVTSEAGNSLPHQGCQGSITIAKTDSGKAKEQCCGRPRKYPWDQLMTRGFGFDILACPRCGARMRILAAINPPDAIRKILGCLGLPTRAPPIAPALTDRDERQRYGELSG